MSVHADEIDVASSPDPSVQVPDPILPDDAAGWRTFLAALPARDVLRTLQKEKAASARILAGFRASPEMVRHPVVLQRLVDEALKQPAFAREIGKLTPPPPPPAAPVPPVAEEAKVPKEPALVLPDSPDPRLKDKVKEQRSALREKDARLAELEAAVATLQRERDMARTAEQAAQLARRVAEEEAERIRRQRERDTRRDAAEAAKLERKVASPRTATVQTADSSPIKPVQPGPLPFGEALGRLINRGKYSQVGDVCHEALIYAEEIGTVGSAARGKIHSLYAAALYGQGIVSSAEEQDRLAVTALMDGSAVIEAASCLARLLTQTAQARASDAPLLRRLLLLAEKLGGADEVRAVFARMRIGSPEAYRRLRGLMEVGGKRKGNVEALLEGVSGEGAISLGSDEAITLPNLAGVSARQIVGAVASGDGDYIVRVRTGMEALRQRGGTEATLADALLEAVAGLEAVSVQPLLNPDPQPIVVDASNIARNNPDPLSLAQVSRVTNLMLMRDHLLRRGFFPIHLIADANLRFHVDDRSAYVSLIERHIVRETPPGTSADEELIRESRRLNAPLVTNDRLAEWGDVAFQLQRWGFAILSGGISLTPF